LLYSMTSTDYWYILSFPSRRETVWFIHNLRTRQAVVTELCNWSALTMSVRMYRLKTYVKNITEALLQSGKEVSLESTRKKRMQVTIATRRCWIRWKCGRVQIYGDDINNRNCLCMKQLRADWILGTPAASRPIISLLSA